MIDALGIHEGKWGVIDYKTGKGVYWEAALQTANYAMSLEEQYDFKIEWVLIVNVAKKEPFGVEVVPISDQINAREAWWHAFKLYKKSLGEFLGKPTYSTFFEVESRKQAAAAKSKVEEKFKSGATPF